MNSTESTETPHHGRNTPAAIASRAKKVDASRVLCRICFDSGKPKHMYEGHCVREVVNGRTIVCPTLMATVCRYCHVAGHTVSRCPTLEANKRKNGEKGWGGKLLWTENKIVVCSNVSAAEGTMGTEVSAVSPNPFAMLACDE